jgi:hypothetical protein
MRLTKRRFPHGEAFRSRRRLIGPTSADYPVSAVESDRDNT